ncbi:MAG TPA: glycosyltransferase [Polyangiaceae bacterium]|nr:glycosyltransferase [Polyangiaceae bacterium]
MLVSVVIRSYKRPRELKELVARVRAQQFAQFEIVVLEQSESPSLVAELEALGEPRMHVVPSRPLNPPAARNEAIRHSRGEIILLMDDDDLPLGEDWIERHVRNYDDPACMGVVGRWVKDPARISSPRFPRLLRFLALRFTWWKDTAGFAHNSLRKEGIGVFLGSNASFRRSLLSRIGGWDEGIPMGEEQSFAIKFARNKRPGEKLVFDPTAAMWRRTDIPGGLDRRGGNDWHMRDLEARIFYYRHVVGYYFKHRYRMLLPLFWLRGIQQSLLWIWDPDNGQRSFMERLGASVEIWLRLPSAISSERFSVGEVRRVPEWH